MMRGLRRILGGGFAAALAVGGLAVLAPVAGAATSTTLFVAHLGTATTGNNCQTQGLPCTSVAHALVEAASVSGAVVVSIAGETFTGNATVVAPVTAGDETSLTLQRTTGTDPELTAVGAPAFTDTVSVPVTVDDIVFSNSAVTPTAPTTTTGPATTAVAAVLLGGATITLTNAAVIQAANSGIRATEGASVSVLHTTVDANGFVGITATSGSTVTVLASTISDNGVGIAAATTASVSVTGSTISTNPSGVLAATGATVTVTKTTVYDSTVAGISTTGATVHVTDSTVSVAAQDITAQTASTLTVTESDISHSATAAGITVTGSTASVTASTLTDNVTGLVAGTTSTVTLFGSTMATNLTTAIDVFPGSTVTVGADLLVAETAPTDVACSVQTTGTLADEGYNVVNDTSCGLAATTTNLQTVPAGTIGLGSSGENGGTTPTRPIPVTSVANDLVPDTAMVGGSTYCSGNDQRGTGYPRLVNGATSCAAGAYQPATTLKVTTTALPSGNVGSAYSGQLVASGGAGTETWTVTSGTLPPGVTLASDGALSGTPTTMGTYTFTVSVSDTEGQTATGSVSIMVAAAVTPPTKATGYDLVGSDGGVFVFDAPGQSGGFYGSLPGIGVKPVAPVVGMIPTVTDQGYYLVGADGGVFAFGTGPFLGSLPGIGVVPAQPIVGIVATNTDTGYFLVGRDGGVFAFGTAPFLGSLPKLGESVDNVIGISAEPSGQGYWVVQSTGKVTAFGTAMSFTAPTSTTSPVTAIAGTASGNGYWLVTKEGGVYNFGDATKAGAGTLPSIHDTPNLPIIGIVPTNATTGYWLLGEDGGIFAFNAPFYGSLPGLTPPVNVTNIVGAVPN